MSDGDKPTLLDWLGLRRPGEWLFDRARPLGGFFGFALTLLVSALVLLLLYILARTLLVFADILPAP